MKYTLDTIPVLDAYKADCECPLCQLRSLCEDQYVATMLASAYMEPGWRVESNGPPQPSRPRADDAHAHAGGHRVAGEDP